MTMTTNTRTHACTLDALAEEADAVNNLQQTAAKQALSNQRWAPASISQFRGFTARDPPPPSSNSRHSVSADLCNSVPGGYYADPDMYGNNDPGNGPGDGPGNDPGDDPGDDDDNEDDVDWIDADGELDPNMAVLNNLAVAVSRLSYSTHRNNESSSSWAKVQDLDRFDGTDPKKLQTFLVQCELVYSDWPKAFWLDRAKITFTQSYLKGMALEWFELDLLDTSDPANHLHWMDNWIAFVAELQSTFGLHNPVTDAEHQLDHLQMKDGHRITWYIMDFNWLASQVRGYGDGALWHYFYTGLPDRIKDELSRIGKPWTLDGLHTLSQEIDARHWERKDELARSSKSQSTSSPKPSNSGGNSSKSSNTTSSASTSGSSKLANKPVSGSTWPDLTAKLGKDGKLTTNERKQRLNNNLCMFCGGTGHFANKCHKKVKQAKARAAAAATSRKPDSTSGASSEEKKE